MQLIITMEDGKPIGVSGPLQDKILCLGVLELAKATIMNYQPSQIVPASVVPNLSIVK